MRAPKMILYIDETGISGLLDQLDDGTLIETNTTNQHEKGGILQGGGETGAGFLSVLNLAKISLGSSKSSKKSDSRSRKSTVGPHAHLNLLIEYLQEKASARYFESLDQAFSSAPEHESSWVCTKDNFDLTNVGSGVPLEALNTEQRFVFEINPTRRSYKESDDYYKSPRRAWHLTMSASFERCPRLKGRLLSQTSHEARIFQMYNYSMIPLNVLGCYLKAGLQVQIIPYALWI
jgi:hypothetical protein